MDESLKSKIQKDELSLLLGDLLDYTKYHFRCEEDLMRSLHYPHYLGHRTIHEKLTRQVMDLQLRLHQSESVNAVFLVVGQGSVGWII